MEKFNGRYRIPPARAQWWNYGWDAAYFLTICTKGHDMFFGEVIDDEMVLSEVGKTAELCWQEIPKHAKNIELGVYVVMPNHVHGILILHGDADPGTHVAPMGRDKACLVSAETSSEHRIPGQSRFQNPGPNTISSMIGGYKSAVSKYARRSQLYFEWQSRFYDHIIRSQEEYQRVSEYILNNVANWKEDKFYR